MCAQSLLVVVCEVKQSACRARGRETTNLHQNHSLPFSNLPHSVPTPLDTYQGYT